MKTNNPARLGWGGIVLSVMVIASTLPLAFARTDGVALLLQQSPAQGGKITPGPGVHRFKSHTEVALTAIPERGYQFVYWLGDVSAPAASSTSTLLDTPKIIIAVFEQLEFDLLPVVTQPQSAPVGGAYVSAADYAQGGISPVAGRRPRKFGGPTPPVEEPEEPEQPSDFPVPEGDNFPVPEPIPEPATFCLLGLGAGFLLSGRRRRYRQS